MQREAEMNTVLSILRGTNDGDRLTPAHLSLLQTVIDGLADENQLVELESIRKQVERNDYKRPDLQGIQGLDVDHEGYIYWRGHKVERYDQPYADENKPALQELARRCERLFRIGAAINTWSAVWKWDWYAQVRDHSAVVQITNAAQQFLIEGDALIVKLNTEGSQNRHIICCSAGKCREQILDEKGWCEFISRSTVWGQALLTPDLTYKLFSDYTVPINDVLNIIKRIEVDRNDVKHILSESVNAVHSSHAASVKVAVEGTVIYSERLGYSRNVCELQIRWYPSETYGVVWLHASGHYESDNHRYQHLEDAARELVRGKRDFLEVDAEDRSEASAVYNESMKLEAGW